MRLLAFISITFILFSTTRALSFDFVATAAPSGKFLNLQTVSTVILLNKITGSSYGDVTVHTMCDPTRVCKQDTQSRLILSELFC